MIKKIFSGLFKKSDRKDRVNKSRESVDRLNKALTLDKDIQVLYEEVNQYTIRGEVFKLGDKVLTKSNECDPYMVGEIVEFWNNNGKWSNCIPYVKDLEGKVWGVMGIIKHYSTELENEIKNLRPLEQYNYFVGDIHKYTEEQILEKEKKYEKIQKIKNRNKTVI
jgi:hypothetical protein